MLLRQFTLARCVAAIIASSVLTLAASYFGEPRAQAQCPAGCKDVLCTAYLFGSSTYVYLRFDNDCYYVVVAPGYGNTQQPNGGSNAQYVTCSTGSAACTPGVYDSVADYCTNCGNTNVTAVFCGSSCLPSG
jgi:hypothetical protein